MYHSCNKHITKYAGSFSFNFRFDSRKRPREMDPHKAQMVQRIKSFQKASVEQKEIWYSFCGTVKDPARHPVAFLEDFIQKYDVGPWGWRRYGKKVSFVVWRPRILRCKTQSLVVTLNANSFTEIPGTVCHRFGWNLPQIWRVWFFARVRRTKTKNRGKSKVKTYFGFIY